MASEVLFKSEYVTVDTVPARTAEGVDYRHSRVTPRTPHGAIVIPTFMHEGVMHFGFVLQARPVVMKASVEFPRGSTSDLGADEAVRELVEEMGITGTPLAMRRLGRLNPDTGLLSTEVAVWVASLSSEGVQQSLKHKEAFSGAQPQWNTLNEVFHMMGAGVISCGMTMAALAMLLAEEQKTPKRP